MSLRLSVVAPFAVAVASAAFAGPLNPPAGPIAPTPAQEPRTAINATNTPGDLDSVFRITAPGSYYLAGNLTGVSGKDGIEIAASNVTIDLMGFALTGVTGAQDGILAEGTVNNIIVRNGTVTTWPGDGVDLGSTGQGSLVEGVIASSNGGRGIRSSVGGVVRACVANSNASIGIELFGNGVATDCSARLNVGSGFASGFGCSFSACSARENEGGGFEIDSGGSAIGCTAQGNGDRGFTCGAGVSITSCSARSNESHGIQVTSNCIVLANTCTSNNTVAGDAGGILAGSDNRIEGNHCPGNDRGIRATGTGNVVVRNTCGNNSINWDIAANNVVGPILDRRAPASPAISGNSAPDPTRSLHPNANFTH